MARSVVSVIRTPPQVLLPADPILEANAYAIAEDIVLQLVLHGEGVGLAVTPVAAPAAELAGQPLNPGVPQQDLRALIESGAGVHVEAEALAAQGLEPGDLVEGVRVVTAAELAELLRDAEAVLTW